MGKIKKTNKEEIRKMIEEVMKWAYETPFGRVFDQEHKNYTEFSELGNEKIDNIINKIQ